MVGKHFPTSNMFEIICFIAFAVVLSYILIHFIYRKIYALGAFALLIVVVLLAFAATFPSDIKPLIPALQSVWLFIHVTTVSLGTGAFGVAFVTGLVYLVTYLGKSYDKIKQSIALEIIFLVLLMFIGYSLSSVIFGYNEYEKNLMPNGYKLPPIVAPAGTTEAGFWTAPEQYANKVNSILWAIFSGAILYSINWIIMRKAIFRWASKFTNNVNLELYDEVCYKAVAIGFPLFTLGGLIFGMIYAHQAWGRFWGWDPKETWALITWLYYSAYLHLRLSRGWYGHKSAWLAVIGFVIVMVNLLVVNLIISGLHSYA